MCSYKTLHHTEHGYVVRCNTCSNLQVAFGTTIISFTPEQFDEYKRAMHQYYIANKNCDCSSTKFIQVPTSMQSMMLVYSPDELEQLTEMLEQASLSMEVERILMANEI